MASAKGFAHIPAGGPPPERMAPPEELSGNERRQAIHLASAGTDAMRINLRIERAGANTQFWSARDVLGDTGGQPLDLPAALQNLLRDGLRRLLASMEKPRPQHALRAYLTVLGGAEPRRNGMVVTCRATGAVTDIALADVLSGVPLCPECESGVDAQVTREIVQGMRRLHTVIGGIADAQVSIAIRTFDAPTAEGFR